MNMKMNGYSQYKKTVKTVTDKKQIVLMLYDGAILFLKKAIVAIEEGDSVTKNVMLHKTEAIINELLSSLDFENGGDIADNLMRLYDFMLSHLQDARDNDDIKKIEKVIALFKPIRDGWESAITSSPSQTGEQPGQEPVKTLKAQVAI